MSSVVYSLKNGINRINNPTIGGVFSYGSYTSAGVFTLFTEYEYSDGTPFTSEPFDSSKPLVWKGALEYPHIGFENLTPNAAITPQPFPSFGIYLHPYILDGVRQDVGVRVTIPFSGSLAISSIIQRADLECGDDIGYRIMRNGVAIQSRQFIQSSNTPTSVNTPLTAFSAGDIIDFIVDIGSQSNSYCDDVTLEVRLTYQYTKIPTPVVNTSPILCSTTEITGTTAYVSEGTVASIYNGTTKLYSTSVVLNPVLYNGSFLFTGLDFTNSLGDNLLIVLEREGDEKSDPINFTVQDGGCVSLELLAPVLTEANFCNSQCCYQRQMSGVASNFGDVAIFKHPYTYGDEIIAVANYNSGDNWYVSSSNFEQGQDYVAYLLAYDGSLAESVTISEIDCESQCVLVSTFKGTASGITNGIIRVFPQPPIGGGSPIATGIIRNGKFDLKTPELTSGMGYILQAIKIN